MAEFFRTLTLLLAAATLATSARADSASLLALAQAAKPARYSFALSKGAEFKATADNRSFTVWWAPTGTTGRTQGTIVLLHGHDSYATDEIYLWQPYAERHGHALLALQWWFGQGESSSDYYTPEEMYPVIAARLAEKGVKAGSAMFFGYSRGSANSYAVAALDAAGPAAKRYFGFVFSNAGGAILNYPPTQAVEAGTYGRQPYAGLPWGMYCGEKDPDPQQSGCPAMTASRSWVQRLGANVVLFIDDPSGDHSGFMTNGANVETALATYAQVLAGAYAVAPRGDAVTGSEAECLFDWGEDRYPNELSPKRGATLTAAPYTYRRYPASGTYLGISSADHRLYFVDPSGRLIDLGLAATWSAQARCR